VTGVQTCALPISEVKFTRLSNTRGEKLVHLMKLLKNLSTSYAYKMDTELARTWLNSFQKSFDELKNSWEESINKVNSGEAEEAEVKN